MKLLTTNRAKYAGLEQLLETLHLELAAPQVAIPELQGDDLEVVARDKALWAARAHGEEVMVDDAGLSLLAFPGFPGPSTRSALRSLGSAGLCALTRADDRAELTCVLASSDGHRVESWVGRSAGRLDPRVPVVAGGPGPLASWYQCPDGALAHRRRALEAYGVWAGVGR